MTLGLGSAPKGRGELRDQPQRRRSDRTTPPAPSSEALRAWAELLRLPALFTVPGDALAGAAATAAPPNPRTLLAIGSSLCLYEAGMALNDWADRHEDAAERPHRPLPSGRVRPAAALTAACALTGTGLALAARAGRPALAVAAPLAATVWAYDLKLKHTLAGPVAMAAARALDLLLGAAATTGRTRTALPSAALLGTHTLAVTAVSRNETQGGSSLTPLAALAATALLTNLLRPGPTPHRTPAAPLTGHPGPRLRTAPTTGTETPAHRPEPHPATPTPTPGRATTAPTSGAARPPLPPLAPAPHTPHTTLPSTRILRTALSAAYAATAARPYFHAALNPSPPLTQRAVGGGIRATVPLQAALSARSGARATAVLVMALTPLARRFARKVSIT
ncbi:SCO3242 family prenyltransferase [Streptomyces sp. CC219B]|uniref:SCO3242 family prenyltransferase n=1 Tax=Streptomyces sp. CC219B TaxID=3044574 RepID=UPI0024A7D6DF|nr:UbiA family prenyltransferase [Streptomyces sp. CC219B]